MIILYLMAAIAVTIGICALVACIGAGRRDATARRLRRQKQMEDDDSQRRHVAGGH